MRQVRTAERSQRAPRGQTAPRIRSPKRSPVQPGSAKRSKKPGLFSRLTWRLRGWLDFKRPMLLLTGALVASAVIVALFVGGTVGRTVRQVNSGVSAAVADAGFGIAEVHLAGNQRTPPETILAALGFKPGESIFGADLQAARARLMQLDWVADADVQRRYPDAISVRIVEKLPFALWKSPQGLYVVERSGKLITNKGVREFARLPLLLGDNAPADAADLVDAVSQHRAIAARIKAYQRVSERRWNLILDGGVLVQLPETQWKDELDTLEKLIVDNGILERSITTIDLRSSKTYFFNLKAQQQGQKAATGQGSEL